MENLKKNVFVKFGLKQISQISKSVYLKFLYLEQCLLSFIINHFLLPDPQVLFKLLFFWRIKYVSVKDLSYICFMLKKQIFRHHSRENISALIIHKSNFIYWEH